MYSCINTANAVGSPIRKFPDQSLLDGSPKLIAVCYVLHRLLEPRHPPYALSNLLTPLTLHLAKPNIAFTSVVFTV